MKKSRSAHARDCGKRARENAFLVREIEELKRELKAVRGYKVPRRLTRSVFPGGVRQSYRFGDCFYWKLLPVPEHAQSH